MGIPVCILTIIVSANISKSLNNNKFTFTIELGKAAGWSDYIGNITESFSVQTFGKSAPEKDLAEFFKVNAESIGEKIIKSVRIL